MKLPIALSAMALLSGCVAQQNVQPFWMVKNKPADYFAQQVTASQSEFDACTEISTPFYVQNPRVLMSQTGTEISFKFRTSQCKDKPSEQELYLSMTYTGGWRFYNSASDDNAKSYTFYEVSRDVNGCETILGSASCSYTEDVVIAIPKNKLEQAAQDGLKLQLKAKSGDKTIVEVPANVVKGYVDGLKNPTQK